MNKKPVPVSMIWYAYLKHLEHKPKGYICELKECAELVKEVEKLIDRK